jgi:hypothetical protein
MAMSESTNSVLENGVLEMKRMSEYFLSHGSHPNAADGRCAMEWVSYLAGEQHSDSPVCVSPVLRRFCIALNDRLPDDERQKLRPYLARTIGTVGDGMDDERLQLCREFLLHQSLPFYLDKAGRHEAAEKLRQLPATLTLEATQEAIQFARDEAWDARTKARDRLAAKIRVELEKRRIEGKPDAAAVAVAVAAADADAAAVAVAVAAADADAVAVAVADADAVAVAAADADAVAAGKNRYDAVYWAVREAVKKRAREVALEWVAERNKQMIPAAFDLLERMLPTEVIQLPVVEDAALVCGVPVGV